MSKKLVFRLIRWSFIIIFAALTLYGTSSHPFDLEKSVQEPLKSMEMPSEVEVISVVEENGLYSVLFEDRKFGTFHQVNYKRPLRLFWNPNGGSYGNERRDEILSKFYWGMTTIGDKSFYKVYGYTNDPKVKFIKSNWLEDEKGIQIDEDGYFHFVKVTDQENQFKMGNVAVDFFDQEEKLLYKLDNMNNEIMNESPVANVYKNSSREIPVEFGSGEVLIDYYGEGTDTTVHLFKLDPERTYEIAITSEEQGGILFGPEENVKVWTGRIVDDVSFVTNSDGELKVTMFNPIRVLGAKEKLRVKIREANGINTLTTIPFILEK
ncbi:hypothetical protein [Bacillus sp. AK128]